MEYKHIQTTTALRNQNGIKAHRILDIEDKHLIFQLWLNSDEQGRLMVSMPEEYQIGEFIDLQVIRTSRTSYQVTLIGRTPQKFIPIDGRAIAEYRGRIMDNKNGTARRQQEHKDRQTLTAEEMAVKSAKRTGNERARREIISDYASGKWR